MLPHQLLNNSLVESYLPASVSILNFVVFFEGERQPGRFIVQTHGPLFWPIAYAIGILTVQLCIYCKRYDCRLTVICF